MKNTNLVTITLLRSQLRRQTWQTVIGRLKGLGHPGLIPTLFKMNKLLARLTLVFILLQFFQFSITAQTITDELNDNGQSHLLVSSGEVEDFYIPLNPNYNAITFQLDGASGGSVVYGDCESRGGDGAITKFTIRIGTGPGELRPGNYIRFILGKAGPYVSYEATLGGGGAGGGGGSAILTSPDAVTWEILAAAGGGGGAFQSAFITCLGSQNGQGGRVTTSGGNGAGGSLAGDGGTNGDGGEGGGDIGDGDLAGGGGGAFSDGEGTFSKEGKAGFPDGGAGGAVSEFGNNGGWGFGGGGTGDDGGGGGGGYSGGGGGGLNDNGGGGGSYINPLYALSNSSITAGGSGAVTYDGFAYYKFEDICYAELTGFEYIEPYCDETNLATIQMQFDVIGGNECIIDEDLTFRIWPNSDDYTYLGNGRWSGVKTGLHVVYVKNTRLDEEIEERQIIIGPTELPEAKCKDVTVKLIFSEKIVSDDFIDDGSTPGQCDESISLSVSQNTFSCSDIGENTVELTVTGSSGNSSTCESTVTVEEAFPGGAFCKPNYDFDLAGRESVDISISDIDYGSILSNCSLTKNFFGPPTITCSNYSRSVLYRLEISRQDGSVASSCTTLLTIVDSSRPTAACKEEITVDLDDNGLATIEGEDLDNGSIFNGNCRDYGYFELSQSDFDCTDIGDNEVTLIVYNGYDNSSTCTSTVKVQKLDDNPPIAICQDLTLDLNAGKTATLTADMVANASTDDCGITDLSIESGLQEFDCSHLGQSFEITVKVEDNASQTSTCSASITVADPNGYCNTAPIAVCQDITVDAGDDCQASITAIQVDGGSSDPEGDEITLSLDQTGPFGRGDHLVTLSVDDGSLSSTCNATITVEDNTPPTAICQDITIQLDANGYAQIYIGDIDNGSYDACGIALSNIDEKRVYCRDIGINTKTLDLLDFNGNRSSCQATVTVQDNIAPQAICQDLTVQLDAEGNASITAANIDNGSADACGIANLSLDISSFDCTNVGDNWVTMTATDNNSNSSNCTANVKVEDNTKPVAICQDITVQLDETGQATVTPEQIDNSSTDNCGPLSLSFVDGQTSFDCSAVGKAYSLILDVRDAANNFKRCNAFVTVTDPNSYCNQAPVAICQDITVDVGEDCQATITAIEIDGGSTDSDGDQISFSLDQTGPFGLGDHAVILTVDDDDLSSSCTAIVTVEDNTAPVAKCQNITVQLDETGEVIVSPEQLDGGSMDNCGSPVVDFDNNIMALFFDCSMVGNTYRAPIIVSDEANNVSRCNALITVVDDVAPEVTAELQFQGCIDDDEGDRYLVECISSDNCGSDLTGRAFIALPNLSNPKVIFRKRNRKNLQFLLKQNRITVSAPGNGGAQNWWSQILVDGGVLVQQGQQIDLTGEEGSNSIIYQFSGSGALRKVINTGRLTLTCIAVDPSGNRNSDRITVDQFCNDDGYGYDHVESEATTSESIKVLDKGQPQMNHENVGQAPLFPSFQKSPSSLAIYPNPFASETTIRFAISERSKVSLTVFDLQGRVVNQLQNGVMETGEHLLRWDATDTNGSRMPSGVYLIQFRTADQVINKKVTLM